MLIAGTHSDAGKTVVTAGICRWLARRGVDVAPYKAQNMSLNSAVTREGAEIGRAQAMQAAAAGIEPTALMNPVLLKPGSDTRSQVVVLGTPWTEIDAMGYRPLKARLKEVALDSLATLRAQHEVVICEGAGSPAEINLRQDDIANMGLARAANLPVVIVGDIDRGGVFAALFGTLALLSAEDQALVGGFIINRFRGDARLLAPGLDMLHSLTGRETVGVLRWVPGLKLDAEDSLDLESGHDDALPPVGADVLRVAVVRFPRLSNVTDIDALSTEPGIVVRLVTRPEELIDADLIVLPGTRATVSDLGWLRSQGLASAVLRLATSGTPVLGVCGGYQMLGTGIVDDIESKSGAVDGLGLLPVTTAFGADKVLRQAVGTAAAQPVSGYEIHHGRTTVEGGTALLHDSLDVAEGCVVGSVTGTSWHGLLESDGFRRVFLADVSRARGKNWLPGSRSFADIRQQRLDTLGDLIADGLEESQVLSLLTNGVPAGLPFVPPGAP